MDNYTPLDIGKLGLTTKNSPKRFINLLLTFSAVVFSASFFLYLFRSMGTSSSRASGFQPTIFPLVYSDITKITFIPSVINNVKVDAVKLKSEAKEKYPSLDDNQLIELINRRLFSFLLLKQKLGGIDKVTKLDNLAAIEEEQAAMKADYEKNLIKLDGLYFRVRFFGTRESNISQLNKDKTQLRDLAKSLAEGFLIQAKELGNPEDIVNIVNQDPTAQLLNNYEKSESFKDYNLDPPIFDDPDFYNQILEAPVGEFSPLLTLRTRNSSGGLDEYLYVVYYIEKKTGENLPLTVALDDYISEATIR